MPVLFLELESPDLQSNSAPPDIISCHTPRVSTLTSINPDGQRRFFVTPQATSAPKVTAQLKKKFFKFCDKRNFRRKQDAQNMLQFSSDLSSDRSSFLFKIKTIWKLGAEIFKNFRNFCTHLLRFAFVALECHDSSNVHFHLAILGDFCDLRRSAVALLSPPSRRRTLAEAATSRNGGERTMASQAEEKRLKQRRRRRRMRNLNGPRLISQTNWQSIGRELRIIGDGFQNMKPKVRKLSNLF